MEIILLSEVYIPSTYCFPGSETNTHSFHIFVVPNDDLLVSQLPSIVYFIYDIFTVVYMTALLIMFITPIVLSYRLPFFSTKLRCSTTISGRFIAPARYVGIQIDTSKDSIILSGYSENVWSDYFCTAV